MFPSDFNRSRRWCREQGFLPLEEKHSWSMKSKGEKPQKMPQQQWLDLNTVRTFNVPKSQVSDV